MENYMASKKHKLVNFNYFTPAEAELFLGLKTKRAKKVEKEIVKNALGSVLSAENEVEVDGEVVSVTNAELLALRTVKDALDNPSTSKLKDIASVMGESKLTLDGNVETGCDIFLGIVKEEENDTSIK